MNMKCFLIEINTKPNTTLRLQYAHSLASLAIMAENGGLIVKSIKEVSFDESRAYEISGVQSGLSNIH